MVVVVAVVVRTIQRWRCGGDGDNGGDVSDDVMAIMSDNDDVMMLVM